ncbi:germacrene C synthase-like isoform X2 [Ipomoea triloba]|uniref:germacrene C synthase-like isoform X2 n=1 Tax=Ipomoea triloba TaxID=35885 RepID=UPI00125DE1D5|nr:germacrene C synthase-like isoform X2 [Ipomoea triloba]
MAYNNQLLSVLPSNQTQLDRVTRRSANYHPTIWGDYFLTYSSQPKEVHTQEWLEHQQLKEELKNMLVEVPDTSFKKLDLINKIQRLGVHYQFEKEIEASLEHIFKTYDEFNAGEDQRDLYNVSLCFRLLRQEGYHVSANTFEKFMDCDGKFKESFINNVPALLSLYEASHLRVHGEQVLEEALIFTTSHLESILPNLTNNLRSQVSEALKQPIRKRLIRLDAQKFISTFEPNGTQDALLLKFAKLDFNLLQKEHQRELGSLTRWDAGALIELPEYMRTPYIYLLDIYTEMENELSDNGQLYRVNYAKEEMKKAVGAYFEEAKWYLDGCNPTFEEYMKLAMLTSGYQMMATTSLVGMQEDFVTKDLFDWVNNGTLIVQAASIICRLMDDIVGHEFEQQRGHLDSSVEIYMKEYGKSKEETIREFLERITNAWKDINQQCLKPTSFPMPILIRVLNFARVIDLLYSDEDSYTHSKTKLKDCITSILVNPIS